MKKILSLAYVLILCTFIVACDKKTKEELPPKPDVENPDEDKDDENKDEEEGDLNLADPFSITYPEENDEIKYNENYNFDRTIYIDAENGNDTTNNGLSEDAPIKTLAKLKDMKIKHGDAILLKGGVTHFGTIELLNIKTTTANYIRVGSYGDAKARINAAGEMAGIRIENTSNVYVSDVKITANGGDKSKCLNLKDNSNYNGKGVYMRCGVNITNYNSSATENITLFNIDVRDVFYYSPGETPYLYAHRPCREWNTGNEGEYGWGIKSYCGAGYIENLKITECNVRNVSHTGIKITGDGGYRPPAELGEYSKKYRNMLIEKCNVNEVGAPGMMFTNLKNAIVRNCKIIRPGSRTTSLSVNENAPRANEPRKWGRGSGMWLVRCDGLLFEKNHLERSEGTADCCGAHIDIGNRNIVIQYCLSKDNAGGFVEVLGKNYNCAYRYNVSINDGWRDADDPAQKTLWNTKDMTDGCIVTINGHTSGLHEGPFYTYVYNNTIVATRKFNSYTNPLVFEFEMCAKGIYMANNIFWIPERMGFGWSATPKLEDGVVNYNNVHEYRTFDGVVRDMTKDEINALNYKITNNLYKLYNPSAPVKDRYGYFDSKTMPHVTKGNNHYWDESPLGGNPMFKNYSETNFNLTAEDLIPSDAEVINKGVQIQKLTTDPTSNGLEWGGLNIDKDYFGNPITTPIVGAIVAQ